MGKEKASQLAKEMADLCRRGANSAILFSRSPSGKLLYLVVLTAVLAENNQPDAAWWKPPAGDL